VNQQDHPLEKQTLLINRIIEDIRDLKDEIRTMQVDAKEDRKEFYKALGLLRDSITGNGKEGLAVRVDRNTSFRKSMSRLLWVLFTPVYGVMITLLIKMLFNG